MRKCEKIGCENDGVRQVLSPQRCYWICEECYSKLDESTSISEFMMTPAKKDYGSSFFDAPHVRIQVENQIKDIHSFIIAHCQDYPDIVCNVINKEIQKISLESQIADTARRKIKEYVQDYVTEGPGKEYLEEAVKAIIDEKLKEFDVTVYIDRYFDEAVRDGLRQRYYHNKVISQVRDYLSEKILVQADIHIEKFQKFIQSCKEE